MSNKKEANENRSDWVVHDPEACNFIHMQKYLTDSLPGALQEYAGRETIFSGYDNLDAITSIYPSLYVLGGVSSIGKTTFLHQMADQMANEKHPVLYFAYEQTVIDIATKNLSRTMALEDQERAMPAMMMKDKPEDPRVSTAMKKYDAAEHLYIVECNAKATIMKVEQLVSSFIEQTHTCPIVIIDYLQAIPPLDKNKRTVKESIYLNMRRLKQLQNKYGLVLMVIAALSEQSLFEELDFESFKEVGNMSNVADVLWGMQLQALKEEKGTGKDRRKRIRNAMTEIPRRVELVCLKNALGQTYRCNYKYYPQFDLFRTAKEVPQA